MTIAELLNAKEGENVEFKEAKNSYEFDNLVKYALRRVQSERRSRRVRDYGLKSFGIIPEV